MGVLIEGMEMPTEDEEIIIRIDSNGTVMTEYALPISGTKAISVPPHGRLGDLDAVERNLVKMQMAQKDLVARGIRKSRAVVRDMPTVIPASESKERPAFLPQYELTPRSEEG